MEADSSDFLPRYRSRAGVSVLEFDRVSRDMLPRSDSFTVMVLPLAKYFGGLKSC
jgi:hypothetical protein